MEVIGAAAAAAMAVARGGGREKRLQAVRCVC